MIGLDNSQFHKKLVENNCFLYLSHISVQIIRNTHPTISENLRELEMHLPTSVILDDKAFSVTAIPAGHCPGSIMLLFETDDKNILYTGDYRINPDDLPKWNVFYNSLKIQKKIDTVYLDTTFFLKSYEKFPKREESLEEICSIIKNWIKRSDKHVIALNTSAKYGYEYLFMEIFKQLKMPIHVNEEVYEFYRRVPELHKAVTKYKEKTKIHSACGSTYTVICTPYIVYKVKTIKISAFRWKSENLKSGISEITQNTHFVCYSTHASYEEGAKLLNFLKPSKVEPNVLHSNPSLNKEIYKNIEENLEEKQPKAKKVKLFEVEEEKGASCLGGGRWFDEDVSSILDSPPRNFAS